jgi:ADP-heptose:LPS heptosyltransferase/GT2 family glycosyltransferase
MNHAAAPVAEVTILQIEEPRIGAVVQPGSTILGKGWVVSNTDIESIRLFIGERFCGYANYGGFRPDILERFQSYPQADQSGLTFTIGAVGHSDPAPDLTVLVRTVSGRETRRVVPLRLAGAEQGDLPAAPRAASSGVLWPVRVVVEQARIDEEGLLRVHGWLASVSPVRELRVFLGDTLLGAPELGIKRPDVAALHPEYANAGESGFRLVQGLDAAHAERPVLRLQAICERGLKRQVITPVERSAAARLSAGGPTGTQFCCDIATINPRGSVTLSGWAVAESGIAAIDVECDGNMIGAAKIGLARPDVGNRFPRIAAARNAGFHFKHALDPSGEAPPALLVRVRDGNGAEQEIVLQLQPEEASWIDPALPHDLAPTSIRYDLDQPVLEAETARDPVRTTLTVSGWAVAPSGVDRVEVQIDDRAAERAYYGMRREDVAAALPEFPDALLCGFALHIHARDIGAGAHIVRVVIHARQGDRAERSFRIICEPSGETLAWENIRERLGQVEIDHAMTLLQRLGAVYFDIHVVLPDRAQGSVALARATLASLRGQAYPHWRAVLIAPRGGRGAALPADLAELTRGGAAPADRLVCRLRAGDRLGADALLEFAVRAACHPDEDFIYADDRRHNPTTDADAPFFKPDWSADLLLSFNYIGRAWAARGALLARAGLSVRDFARNGDYACVLRLGECARGIGHVPRLLLDATETAGDAADATALAEAVTRRGMAARVQPGRTPGTFRVAREVARAGRVSVIIPTIAARGLIETTISGLRSATDWPDLEIICIDNIPPGQNLHWKRWLRKHADQVIELPEKFNWSRFNNIGAAAAGGDFLLFLNDDIEIIQPDWLRVLVSHAQRPEIGVVGPQLLYPDGKVQQAGMFLTARGCRHAFRFAAADEPGPFGMALSERNMLVVTGACMLVRRDAFDAVGGFNEIHSVVNNDVDYCLRARRAGQGVLFTPHARLIHHELASRASLADDYDTAAFQAEWGAALPAGDPFYNPNLSQSSDLWAAEAEPTETIHAGHPLVARGRVRRILAVKLDHIGDFVTALPALRRLKQRFPEASLHVLLASHSKSLARLEPCIDGIEEFNFFHVRSGDGQRNVAERELLDLRARLAPYEFDLAVDLRLHGDTRPVLRYTGASLLAGFESGSLFPWLDVVLQWEGDERLVDKRHHISDRLLQLIEAISVACEADRIEVAPPAAAQIAALRDLPAEFLAGTLVCVHPGVGTETRQWPAAHFARLIDLLVGALGARVILIGAADEAATAQSVLEHVSARDGIVSLVGKTGLADLPAVLRACGLYVGNNSGPKHLAAALGVPTLGVHSGVVDAREWGPVGPNAVAVRRRVHCGPCYIASAAACPRAMACMTGLLPTDVYRACLRLLGKG